jgi:hypothetical protein
VKSVARSRPCLSPRSAFAGFRFPAEVIVVAVRWYLRYALSYRDVEELVAVEERAGDVAALVTRLRLPDEKRTGGFCTADLVLAPWLVLLDAQGRWIRPGVPVDGCGRPRREFRAAVEQLRTDRVSSRVLWEIESDRAAAAGCSQVWADMVWAAGRSGSGENGVPGTLAADYAEVRVCVYRVPARERGTGKPAGQFESGRTLAAGTWGGREAGARSYGRGRRVHHAGRPLRRRALAGWTDLCGGRRLPARSDRQRLRPANGHRETPIAAVLTPGGLHPASAGQEGPRLHTRDDQV